MNNRRVAVFVLRVTIGFAVFGGLHQSASAQGDPSPATVVGPSVTTAEEPRISDEQKRVDNLGLVALGSIVIAGLTIALGSIGPALGEGRAVAQALSAIAQQPDSSNTITRTLFVGLAMIESTAIYCFVVSMILLFANPYWNYFIQ